MQLSQSFLLCDLFRVSGMSASFLADLPETRNKSILTLSLLCRRQGSSWLDLSLPTPDHIYSEILSLPKASLLCVFDDCRFNIKFEFDHLDSLSLLPVDYEYDWARAWTRLKQIFDMTEEEFSGEIADVGQDSGLVFRG